MRERGTLLAAVCSHCAVSLREERLLHSRPSIYAERKEEFEKGGISVMVVQTDTQTWTDINLLVGVSHLVCTQAVMQSHSVLCPLTPLSCVS